MRTLTGWAWAGVIIIAVALSNWSLAVVGHRYGLPDTWPYPIAWLLSIPFDGAALVCAGLSLGYARELGGNGAGPRTAVTILAAISAWLNSEHATILHLGFPAHVLYACPPVVAVVIFELHTRYQRRAALAQAGRLAEPRPVLGSFVWMTHPLGSLSALSEIGKLRLDTRKLAEQSGAQSVMMRTRARLAIERTRLDAEVLAESSKVALTGATKAEAIQAALDALGPDAQVSDVQSWLDSRGIDVDRSYIYSTRNKALPEGDRSVRQDGRADGVDGDSVSLDTDSIAVDAQVSGHLNGQIVTP